MYNENGNKKSKWNQNKALEVERETGKWKWKYKVESESGKCKWKILKQNDVEVGRGNGCRSGGGKRNRETEVTGNIRQYIKRSPSTLERAKFVFNPIIYQIKENRILEFRQFSSYQSAESADFLLDKVVCDRQKFFV